MSYPNFIQFETRRHEVVRELRLLVEEANASAPESLRPDEEEAEQFQRDEVHRGSLDFTS